MDEERAVASLRVFEPYTSRRLHWFPYEITRCTSLRRSVVSTRALYGNYKTEDHVSTVHKGGTGIAQPRRY